MTEPAHATPNRYQPKLPIFRPGDAKAINGRHVHITERDGTEHTGVASYLHGTNWLSIMPPYWMPAEGLGCLVANVFLDDIATVDTGAVARHCGSIAQPLPTDPA